MDTFKGILGIGIIVCILCIIVPVLIWLMSMIWGGGLNIYWQFGLTGVVGMVVLLVGFGLTEIGEEG